MDDKNKFEIEFEDDDFDSWLEMHDKVKEEEKKKAAAAPAPIPVSKPVPVQKPASTVPPVSKPVQRPASAPRVARQDLSSQSKPGNSEPKDIPISRRETVKNFRVKIDEEEFKKPAAAPVNEPVTEPQKRDKSIYFANRKPSKAELEHRRAQEKAMQEQKKEEKIALQQQRLKEREQISRLRKILIASIILLVSFAFSAYGISCINDVLALNRSDSELISVTIEKDQNYKDIINILGDNKLIKHEWFCKLLTKFRDFDKKTYLNGLYYLTPSMGVEGMLNEMRQTQTSDETIRLYFPEGWTIPQIIEKLDENNVCPAEYIYAALREVEFENKFVSNIPKTDGRYFTLEGYIFPDTYDFFVSTKKNGIGENPNSIIRKFLGNFESKWTEIYAKRAKELGLTMDEVMTIASIIQKEAADESQMTAVSSVIHNRLNHPADYPTLGCDSTQKYVTSYLSKAIGTANASTYSSFYNTNGTRSGLPIGPICNPGTAAIEAALNPDDTGYYYFCHNEAGKIYLAKTYNEFQSNWAQVLKDNEGLTNDDEA